jgi:hypothetical protein
VWDNVYSRNVGDYKSSHVIIVVWQYIGARKHGDF